MLLHKLILNLKNAEARRDIASPYELHSTLSRAFSQDEIKCASGTFLWRLESTRSDYNQLLVQSSSTPDWAKVPSNWFIGSPSEPLDLISRLNLNNLQKGQRFRFRLQANPSVKRQGKRFGLFQAAEQEAWLMRKGEAHGFEIAKISSFSSDNERGADIMISQNQLLRSKQRNDNKITIYSVLYDGYLSVQDPEKFLLAIQTGIGHGKAMGLGLFSVVRTNEN